MVTMYFLSNSKTKLFVYRAFLSLGGWVQYPFIIIDRKLCAALKTVGFESERGYGFRPILVCNGV